jgi:hypothetical protein
MSPVKILYHVCFIDVGHLDGHKVQRYKLGLISIEKTVNNILLASQIVMVSTTYDRLCGLVVRVFGYRSGGPGSIPGTTTRKKVVGLERGALTLVSTTEELLDRKVAAPV